MLLLILSVDVNTTAVLLAFVPSSDISSAIRPFEGAFSLLHVVDILADVLAAIRPCEGSITLHLVVAPLSREYTAVSPLIDSGPVNVVIIEITSVSAIVSPCELALSVLLSLEVLAFV